MVKVKFLKAIYPFNKWDIWEVEEGTFKMFKHELELIESNPNTQENKKEEGKKIMDWKTTNNKAILTPKKTK